MEGTVLNYDPVAEAGVIRATDGKRYKFARSDWSSSTVPITGDNVDFEPVEGRASEIFLTTSVDLKTREPATQTGRTIETGYLGSGNDVGKDITSPASSGPASSGVNQSNGFSSAKFFIAYFIVTIPTYVLPYFGSNSMIVNGISDSLGGFTVQFWWHVSCYATLLLIAYIRGEQVSKVWLVIFPVFAAFFDLAPVLNNLPLVPTVFHVATLYIGCSRANVERVFDFEARRRLSIALSFTTVTILFIIYKVWTTPFTGSNGFAASLLLWPLVSITTFFAYKFGFHANSIAPETGSRVNIHDAANDLPGGEKSSDPRSYTFGQFFTSHKVAISLSRILILLLCATTLSAVGVFWINREEPPHPAGLESASNTDSIGSIDQDISSSKKELFVFVDTTIVNKPTAQGAELTGWVDRGSKLLGTMQTGNDGSSQWFKLADGRGYVRATDLSEMQPPILSHRFVNLIWNVETSTSLFSRPNERSDLVQTVKDRDQIVLAGVTDNGFAEVKLKKGGVAYFLVSRVNDRNDELTKPKSVDLNFSVNSCGSGSPIEDVFKALSDEQVAESEMNDGPYVPEVSRSVNWTLYGLHISVINIGYGVSRIYFQEPYREVAAAFAKNGHRLSNSRDKEVYDLDNDKSGLSASISATDVLNTVQGKSVLECGSLADSVPATL